MVSIERLGAGSEDFFVLPFVGAWVTQCSSVSWRANSAAWSWSESVERRSSHAVAEAGMELIAVPPEIWPMLRVVRGSA